MDYYQILGVERNADDETIKRAYREAAKRHHPDRNGGSVAAEAMFKAAFEAYHTLIDPQRRKSYNQKHPQKVRRPEKKKQQKDLDLRHDPNLGPHTIRDVEPLKVDLWGDPIDVRGKSGFVDTYEGKYESNDPPPMVRRPARRPSNLIDPL